MTSPATLLAFRWLIWDTFRQTMASRLLWLLLGVTGLAVLFCLGTNLSTLPLTGNDGLPAERLPSDEAKKIAPGELELSGVDVIRGRVTFLFSAVNVPWQTYREDAVQFLQFILAGGIADTFGLLFVLVWTAGMLPGFLEPASATVLLAKPVPRWGVLIGKYLGVVTFVGLNITLFVLCTWVALGLRSGVWSPRYLLSVPVMTVNFAFFFSFSALLAVLTRSCTSCVFGTLVFWIICWGVNLGRYTVQGPWWVEASYWALPKPADMSYLLANIVGTGKQFPEAMTFQAAERVGSLSLEMTVLSCIAFSVLALTLAKARLSCADY